MAVKYGYFNSVDGDRKYNAEDMTMYFKGLVSDGIYQTIGEMFTVSAVSGLTVKIGTGRALVNMHWIENDAPMNISLGVASVSADTYRLIVLRCDLSENVRSVSIVAKDTGTSGTITLTNDDYVTELCIAQVKIRKNATAISQSDISDYRGTAYCPWITGLIKQVDTSTLSSQFMTYYVQQTAELQTWLASQKASFENWLETLQSELNVNTKLAKYQSTYTTTADTTEIPLISNYADGDVLLVHIGGVLLVEDAEYTIDTTNSKIVLKQSISTDNPVTQFLIKSVIG